MFADGVLCHYLRIYTSVCAGRRGNTSILILPCRRSRYRLCFLLFLMGIWLFIVVLLAVLDDLFRQLSRRWPYSICWGWQVPAASSVISSYPDYIYLRRILVFDRFCMGIPQKASHFAAGFTLSLRQMRAETEGEGSLPTLRSYQ